MRFRVLNGGGGDGYAGTVAVSGDETAPVASGGDGCAGASPRPWLLLNLSGAAACRLDSDPALAGLARAHAQRQQPVLLTDAQLDQVAGLISLRGAGPIDLYATPSVFEDLTTTLPVLPELERQRGVHWHMVPVAGDRRVAAFAVRGHEQLAFTAFDTGGADDSVGDPSERPPGHSIAVAVEERGSGRRAVFARGLGAMALSVLGALEGVHCLMVDPGPRRDARSHAELAAWMATLPVPRKLLLGPDAADWRGLGIEAPVDGAEIVV